MRRAAVLLLLLTAASAPAAVVPVPEPTSYAKPVPGGQFLLVQLGNKAAEDKFGGTAEKQRFAELRAKFPKPGLYTTADPPILVWPLPETEFAHYDHVFPAPDGVHFVRVDGDFWQSEAYTGGKLRPSPEAAAAQIDGPAVSFFKNGELVRRHTVRDLVERPDELTATPLHLLWYASGRLQVDTMRFNLFTQESVRHTFDATTGEKIATTKVGLANPLTQNILIVIGAMTAAILLGWVVFVARRRPAPVEPAAVPSEPRP